MSITHQFTSTKSDGGDATLVRPSDWNASHSYIGVEFITETVLGADAANITITGLPATYRDLFVVIKARSTNGAVDDLYLRVGTSGTIDTGAHYSYRLDYGISGFSGSGADGAFGYAMVVPGSNRNTGVFALGEVTMYDYHSSEWKMMHGRGLYYDRAVEAYSSMSYSAWNQTTAIDCVRVYPNVGPNLKAGSKVTIYGRG